MTWKNRKSRTKLLNKKNWWIIESKHKLGDNMVVPIIISPNGPILGCKLININ